MNDSVDERKVAPGYVNETYSWRSFFTASAEKRAMLGPDVFLRTHVPVLLEREDGTRCNEEEVLARLFVSPEDPLENRVWFLVGQRGAGKTEVLEWLALEVAQREPQRVPYLLHIRSHETSLPHLLSKCKRLLGNLESASDQAMERRWGELSQKPALVSKILLLLALDQLASSDDEWIALYYRLTNLMDDQMRTFFRVSASGASEHNFELISSRAWRAFREETALPVPFSYEAFHQAFQTALERYLLDGQTLSPLLQAIVQQGRARGIRPVLLIDDVLSSLHIAAPDTLCSLLSMPGGWDVICTVTTTGEQPRTMAFAETLLQASGVEGWYHVPRLEVPQCLNIARAYGLAFWREQGQEQEGTYPFTDAVIERLAQGLPPHKCTARAFLRHLFLAMQGVERVVQCTNEEGREVARLELLSQLAILARREYVVTARDERHALLGEVFGPLSRGRSPGKDSTITLSPQPFFGVERSIGPLPIREDKERGKGGKVIVSNVADWIRQRGWLEPEEAALLRKGVSRLLHDVLHVEALGGPRGGLSPLHWHQPYKGVAPPVIVHGEQFLNKAEGIVLPRVSLDLALELIDYATVGGQQRRTSATYLAHEEQLASFFQQARHYQQQKRAQAEQALGTSLEGMAVVLAFWAVLLGEEEATPEIGEVVRQWDIAHQLSPLVHRLVEGVALAREWNAFFREILLPLPESQQYHHMKEVTSEELLAFWTREVSLDQVFRWRGRPAQTVLAEWRALVRPCVDLFAMASGPRKKVV